jgi:phospholipase/carboxylesterase
MSGERLEFERAARTGLRDGATVAVLLHGRGSHRGDLQALAPVLPEDWGLVTPQAPFPGMPWGYGPGWAWYRYVAENRLVPETLEQSLGLLDDFLERLPDLLGFTPGPIVLGGFSQGGTTSVAYALSRPGRITAALNFSGFLADSVEVPTGAAAQGATPVFWGHGTKDPSIPFGLAVDGRARLHEAGVPLTVKDYAIGHWMVPEEIHDAVAMVQGVVDAGQSPGPA